MNERRGRSAEIEGPWWNAGEVARGRNIGAHENSSGIGAINTSSRVREREGGKGEKKKENTRRTFERKLKD